MKRTCVECNADISHRHVNARTCIRCSGRRAIYTRRGADRVQPSRQPAIKRAGPGTLFPRASGYEAVIEVNGVRRVRNYATREEAEQWLAEVAQCRTI